MKKIGGQTVFTQSGGKVHNVVIYQVDDNNFVAKASKSISTRARGNIKMLPPTKIVAKFKKRYNSIHALYGKKYENMESAGYRIINGNIVDSCLSAMWQKKTEF